MKSLLGKLPLEFYGVVGYCLAIVALGELFIYLKTTTNVLFLLAFPIIFVAITQSTRMYAPMIGALFLVSLRVVFNNAKDLPISLASLGVLAAILSIFFEIIYRDNISRKQAEESLRQAYATLERRVEERTIELSMSKTSLETEIDERKRTEEELRHASVKMRDWANELEQRNHEITLLNEMGDLLQLCQTSQETYSVAAKFAQQLFPGQAGAWGIINASRTFVETVVAWSDLTAQDRIFSPDDCWALRRGHPHLADAESRLMCAHFNQKSPAYSLCVPMMAQGEALGILYLWRTDQAGTLPLPFTDAHQNLAVTLAERVSLALVNLNLRESLRNQAIRDPLTGLFNRRYMEETLERELYRATRRKVTLAVIMFDIDHFKTFNDLHGHAAGDLVLRGIGDVLRTETRAEDITCRYGGEEFFVILPDISQEHALERAERLRTQIKQLNMRYDDRSLGAITVSLGIAIFPQHGLAGEALIKAADEALYDAKRAGRNRLEIAPDAN
ncbi:MAG: diguanylate cyclase [Chloroflexi bacterium]|nr:diguanylate cyclase [Chloroflexota bacterium]